MSGINFNDFNEYAGQYNPRFDYFALFGGGAPSMEGGADSISLSDYAMVKSGSYKKLMKAYYAKQGADRMSQTGDSSKTLTLMRSSADSLKKSAEALSDASLWQKKKIRKKDKETGEETETWDYDWEAITKAVKSFVSDYNAVIEQAGSSETGNVLRYTAWMTEITGKAGNLLSKAGITIGKGNKLEFDEEAMKKATIGVSGIELDNISTLKFLFTGHNSFADKIAQKAGGISRAASNAAAAAKATYTKNGGYSHTLSKLFESTFDEKVGDKIKDKVTDKSYWESKIEKEKDEKD